MHGYDSSRLGPQPASAQRNRNKSITTSHCNLFGRKIALRPDQHQNILSRLYTLFQREALDFISTISNKFPPSERLFFDHLFER